MKILTYMCLYFIKALYKPWGTRIGWTRTAEGPGRRQRDQDDLRGTRTTAEGPGRGSTILHRFTRSLSIIWGQEKRANTPVLHGVVVKALDSCSRVPRIESCTRTFFFFFFFFFTYLFYWPHILVLFLIYINFKNKWIIFIFLYMYKCII